jgi:hypothetical protein
MKPFFLMLMITLAGQTLLLGQSNQKIEEDLKTTYEKILNLQFNKLESDTAFIYYDSVTHFGVVFMDKLLHYTSTNPATLTWHFDSLQQYMNIVTSGDRKFRIYSWDTWTGGTMHFFDNVYQYNAFGKIKSMTSGQDGENDPKSTFYKIFQVKTPKNTIYIAAYNAVYSGRDKAGGVKLFTIEKGGLNDTVKLFRTGSGLRNMIHYNFDMVSREEGVIIPEVKWEAATKTLLIPLIDDRNKPTGRYLHYRFDGTVFRRMK